MEIPLQKYIVEVIKANATVSQDDRAKTLSFAIVWSNNAIIQIHDHNKRTTWNQFANRILMDMGWLGTKTLKSALQRQVRTDNIMIRSSQKLIFAFFVCCTDYSSRLEENVPSYGRCSILGSCGDMTVPTQLGLHPKWKLTGWPAILAAIIRMIIQTTQTIEQKRFWYHTSCFRARKDLEPIRTTTYQFKTEWTEPKKEAINRSWIWRAGTDMNLKSRNRAT